MCLSQCQYDKRVRDSELNNSGRQLVYLKTTDEDRRMADRRSLTPPPTLPASDYLEAESEEVGYEE
jgi:hypothetical protein